MGSTKAGASAGSGSPSSSVSSPTPFSQSTFAEGTIGALSTEPDIDAKLPPPAAQSSAVDKQNDQVGKVEALSLDEPVPESQKRRTDSVTATAKHQKVDATPGAAHSSFSGNNSPDSRLEKEYHKEKERDESTTDNYEDQGSSDDDDSSSRGRQKSREKKHYRRESDASATDTDRGNAKETPTISGKKPPPRKLKTFEPLREKEESTLSGYRHP